jgi:hypothetical protein
MAVLAATGTSTFVGVAMAGAHEARIMAKIIIRNIFVFIDTFFFRNCPTTVQP